MTRHPGCGRPDRDRSPAGPSSARPAPGGRRAEAGEVGRPVLTLVRGARGGRRTPVDLSLLTPRPMPDGVRGALVTVRRGRVVATWVPAGPFRVPPGRVLLSWTGTADDRTDVTARLGLAGAQVLLAVWPGLRGEWSGVVRPTVAEVTELHAALHLATAVLERLAD
ncbi:hypothetical protein [Streptomyces sp. NPDC046988]|uniref:hypothetical protein n=1 Tax=Streptomyces sp. NPDC046988 TaxID=3154922 RepID=UPI0033F45C79